MAGAEFVKAIQFNYEISVGSINAKAGTASIVVNKGAKVSVEDIKKAVADGWP
ncbi:hypothetical protein MYX84_10505 [Acidobacteria bacterium AH-259-O06]|nr:hypothetical protein [Acidobacteria bacterium AH-259-O06]